MAAELCACGQPLHYSDPELRVKVQKLVALLGPEVKISVLDGLKRRSYMVPRHYIALHGIKARDLPGSGFREVE